MDRRLSRRTVCRLGLVAGAGGVLAACGATPAPSPAQTTGAATTVATQAVQATPQAVEAATQAPSSNAGATAKVTLSYWHSWTEQWEKMVIAHMSAFNEKNPDIKVNEIVVPGGEIESKFLTAVAAGNPPDSMMVNWGIGGLVGQNAILPLGDYVDLSAAKDWIHPMIYKYGVADGKLYATPYWAGSLCIIWNKNTFALSGLDPEAPPKSLTELDELADKLTTYDSRGNISVMGFLPTDLFEWGTVYGGSFYNPDTRKITANDPKIQAALEWEASYSKKYDVKKIQAFQSGLVSERAATLDPLISGKFAMQVHGPWKLGDIRKYGDPHFKWGVIAPPAPQGEQSPATWSWGDMNIVAKGTKYPKDAATLVLFLSGVGDPEGYAKRVHFDGETYRPINVPVSLKTLDDPFTKKMIEDFPGYDVFINTLLQGKHIEYAYPMPVWSTYSDRFTAAEDKGRLMEQTPKEALDAVTTEVQAAVDKWYQEHGG